VDFELFRSDLQADLHRADRSHGGRPPHDAVLMFRILVLQAVGLALIATGAGQSSAAASRRHRPAKRSARPPRSPSPRYTRKPQSQNE
jgi:hypothetical protein